MRVGFAGTPDFAARALSALHEAGYTIPLVLTQPDRPHGRGMKVSPSPVKALALNLGIPVHQPASLKPEAARSAVLAVPLDVLVVAAYGLILPPAVLSWPRHGCLNIHASRLPRWRGAAPIARAIEAGDADTGVTIMQMDAGLDTGPMIAVTGVTIDPRDTTGTLQGRLAQAGATAILAALAQLAEDGSLSSRPQPDSGVTYAAKITRDEAMLDWRLPAATLDRQVRAFDPAPGAWSALGGSVVKVVEAHAGGSGPPAAPGTAMGLSADGLDVACGQDGVERLRLGVVKPAGRRAMTAAAFAAGHAIVSGSRFEQLPCGGSAA